MHANLVEHMMRSLLFSCQDVGITTAQVSHAFAQSQRHEEDPDIVHAGLAGLCDDPNPLVPTRRRPGFRLLGMLTIVPFSRLCLQARSRCPRSRCTHHYKGNPWCH